MKIRSKQPGIKIMSINPPFSFDFEDEAIDVPESIAEKLLKEHPNLLEKEKSKKKTKGENK